MSDDLQDKAHAVNDGLARLNKIGRAHHAAGDNAARLMAEAARRGDRRTMRKWQNANSRCRAAATAVEASLFLFGLVNQGMSKRSAPLPAGVPNALRTVEHALEAVDDHVFKAAIITSMEPQPSTARKRKT